MFPVDELVGIGKQLAGHIDLVNIAHVGVVVMGNVNNWLILPHHGTLSCEDVAEEVDHLLSFCLLMLELDGGHHALCGGGVMIEGGAGVWLGVASVKEVAEEL